MKRLYRAATPLITASRQLSLAVDPGPLCRVDATERAVALGRLPYLLLETAGVVAQERDDGER